MKKTGKKFGVFAAFLVFVIQLTVLSAVSVHAAGSASVKVSAGSILVGKTVTVTVSYSGGGKNLGAISGAVKYNTSVLDFVSGSSANESTKGTVLLVAAASTATHSFTLTFKAKAAGTSSFQLSTDELYALDATNLGRPGASASVTVRTVSGNADLKSLSVNTGTLSPKFAAGTTAYSVSVANSVSSITVSAASADGNAKVTGTGKQTLKVGSNKINIKVTAENGATKTYILTVKRDAATAKPDVTLKPSPKPTEAQKPSASANGAITPAPTKPSSTVPGNSGETAGPDTETPVQTPTPDGTGTNTSAPVETTPPAPGQTAAPAQLETKQSGLFSLRSAFIICALGMLIVGAAGGFIVCYVIKSKKS